METSRKPRLHLLPSALSQQHIYPDFTDDAFSPGPLLADVLGELGPLPREALYLGQAEDGLPVLLDLFDAAPGPMLILGKSDTGKTDILRNVARYVIASRTPLEVQFAVISNREQQWPEIVAGTSHCVGTFTNGSANARKLLHSLALWIANSPTGQQAVLLLLDELEDVQNWDPISRQYLQHILIHGPAKRVWPIVTLKQDCEARMQEWIGYFRLRVFEHDLAPRHTPVHIKADRWSRSPLKRPSFSVWAHGEWISFWVPG